MAKYLKLKLNEEGKGEEVFGIDYSSKIRGKTPEEAAEILLTTGDGTKDDENNTEWGSGQSDVWNQEKIGENIG